MYGHHCEEDILDNSIVADEVVDMDSPSVVYCPTAEADTVLVYWDRWTLADAEGCNVARLCCLLMT